MNIKMSAEVLPIFISFLSLLISFLAFIVSLMTYHRDSPRLIIHMKLQYFLNNFDDKERIKVAYVFYLRNPNRRPVAITTFQLQLKSHSDEVPTFLENDEDFGKPIKVEDIDPKKIGYVLFKKDYLKFSKLVVVDTIGNIYVYPSLSRPYSIFEANKTISEAKKWFSNLDMNPDHDSPGGHPGMKLASLNGDMYKFERKNRIRKRIFQ